MDNSSVVVTDITTTGLIEFQNFTMNDTISRLSESFSAELAMSGLRATNDPVYLKASTLRTAVAVGLRAEIPTTESTHVVIAFWDSPLSHGINVFVGIVLCFTMLGLGCTVDVSQLGDHIRRPIGVLLALVCQFVIMPLVAFLLALAFSLNDVAAMAVLLCGCCPGGNLSNIMSLLVNGEMNLSIIMTISSTVLALVLMPLCLWIYSRAWINTPVVNLMPFGAIILTLCSTLIPIGLGVVLRYRYSRAADIVLKVSLWSLLVTLVMLFIMTGAMLGPELLATIPPSVYVVAVLMPACGYAAGYGLATLFDLPPNVRRTVSLETGCQNVQLCTAILKMAFPPQLMGGMYMFPLLYALFQAAEAGIFIVAYQMYRKEVLQKPDTDPLGSNRDIGYNRFEDEDMGCDAYGSVTTSDPNLIMLEPCPDSTPV
ncbi:sodium/bile acid cotransporter 4 [Esox lucius]|uniref:Sodium/bile acid cotransporter 4 n=1 Tax=Esox lucius TaxID=8010 RepID=A0A3P8ZIW2_ESOLU|nr:sodium/bile acid cotransporter 4 [Esox lucius]